ncbi:hypothetical protein BKA93DRAFT_813666 [Sparassis latifolia]
MLKTRGLTCSGYRRRWLDIASFASHTTMSSTSGRTSPPSAALADALIPLVWRMPSRTW